MGIKESFDWDQADTQCGQGAVEVIVLGACFAFAHAVVAHPVVSDLTAAPVAAGEAGELARASLFRRVRSYIEGDLRDFVRLSGAGALDDY